MNFYVGGSFREIRDGLLAWGRAPDFSTLALHLKLATVRCLSQRKTAVLISLLSLASIAHGADWKDTRNFTKGVFNGRGWMSFDFAEKLMFAQAYYGGWQMGSAMMAAVCNKDDECLKKANTNDQYLPDIAMSDVIAGVDEIYSHPENRSIEICKAMFAFSLKVAGLPSDVITEALRVARQGANEQQQK